MGDWRLRVRAGERQRHALKKESSGESRELAVSVGSCRWDSTRVKSLNHRGHPSASLRAGSGAQGGKLPGLMQPVREGLIKSLLAPDVALNAGVFAGEGARATLDQRFLRGWRL